MGAVDEFVITGLGVVSPIGLSAESYLDALGAGRVGIRSRAELAASNSPFAIGGTIEEFDGRQFVRPRKAIKVMCRPIQFGFAVAWMAAEQARLTEMPIDPDRLGIVFGAETFYADPVEMAPAFRACMDRGAFVQARWGTAGLPQIPPLWMLQYLANMIASHISIAVDARGPSNTICQGDTSSSLAMIEGCELLRRGWADAVIIGGASSQTMMTAMVYRGAHRLSRRIEDPQRACRPFDAHRDGMVLGEGAGAVVLETVASASRRGAPALAKIAGWARGFAHGPPMARVERMVEVARAALDQAGIGANDLSHVNATGLGTVEDDALEALAISAIGSQIPVLALKANLGNLGPGADIVELIGSVGAVRSQVLPPAPNYETPDPRCPVQLIPAGGPSAGRYALKLSVNSTGQIAAIVIAAGAPTGSALKGPAVPTT